jgi:multiple sugar transport system substrate-binding protein
VKDQELLRVIEYLERVRQPYHALFPMADPDPVWNIAVHLVRSHIRGDVVTISKLAQVAEVPFTTAMRRIEALIQQDLIRRRPIGRTGKTFSLHPSETMLAAFLSYARQTKSLLAQTVGMRPNHEVEDDYYFGGSRLESHLAPPPALLQRQLKHERKLRFLMHADDYCSSLQNLWADYRNNLGSRRDFDLRPLPALYDRVVENARADVSAYDVIMLNVPWLGDAVESGYIRRAEDYVYQAGIDSLDFDPRVWATGRWRGRQEAVPIFASIELMAVRRDLFQEAGLTPPRSFADVLAAGRAFHAPERGRYGIAWNGQRGMPLASTFLFLLACCGGAVVNLPRESAIWSLEQVDYGALEVTVATENARQALAYMHELVPISPPGVLDMSWNTALELFMNGHAAMIYCWSMRAARFEYDVRSKVKRRVQYLPQPAGPGGDNVSPLGGFLLAVPSNLQDDRVEMAFEAIRWMTSPEAIRMHIRTGFPVLPRFSMSADPEIAASSPIVPFVNDLARRNLLQTWQRPPLPQYRRIEMVLGDEIHAALTHAKSDAQALASARARVEKILRVDSREALELGG